MGATPFTGNFGSTGPRWSCLLYTSPSPRDRQTDRRIDGQIDRILIARLRLHSMQRDKNRPYLLQMSNYTVYFNAKRRFWARASKRSTTRSMSICCTMSRSTLQTTNLCAFANSKGGGHVSQCPMPGDATALPPPPFGGFGGDLRRL